MFHASIDCLYGVRTEVVVRSSSLKMAFLKSAQNSQENICVRVSFLVKLRIPLATFLKRNFSADVFF